MKLVHKRKDSIVYYNEVNNTYVKKYTPYKWYTKRGFRTFLGIMTKPGLHVQYICTQLHSLGIATFDIVEAEDYQVITKAIEAETIRSYRAKHGNDALRNELLEVLSRLLQAGIVHLDFKPENFLYDGIKIYVIDVESLDNSPHRFLPKQKLLYYTWKSMGCDDSFAKQILEIWPERSLLRKTMDLLYTMRSFFVRLVGKGNKREQDFVKRMQL